MEQQLILDRYRPLADLGSGGHASVTLAYDTRMGRRVAIKRLPLPRDARGQATTVGLAEARTAALLNHPAIVTVHEWDTDADEAFIIMEHIAGASLAELIDRLGRLDLDEGAALVAATASALEFAHANGVLHLDIKPENVLVTREGDIKVADFGISALTDAEGGATAEAGTLGYMPLEQLRGDRLDPRTDEWALAALAFEAVTGENPFAAASVEGALIRAGSPSVPAPSERADGIPAGVDDVLLAALAPDPAERYRSVAEFASALMPHLGDPAAGRESLAGVADELSADETAEDDHAYRHLGLWDRMAWLSPTVARVTSAAASGWLAYLAFSPLPMAASLAATALVALAGVLAPPLGFALGLGAFAGSAFRLGMLQGAALFVVAAVFWIAVCRHGRGEAVGAVAAPVAGALHIAPAVPLLLGFTFEPLKATVASAFAGLFVTVASAASGSGAPLVAVDPAVLVDPWTQLGVGGRLHTLVAGPGPLLAVAGWAACGAIVSVLCRRGTRFAAAAGVVLGTLALIGGYWLWASAGPALIWPSTSLLQQVAASLILMTVVVALGPPVRGEGDDE